MARTGPRTADLKHARWVPWVVGPVACVGALASVGGVLAADQAGRVAPGVTVAGVDIGGLDRAAAEKRIDSVIGPRLKRPVLLRAGGKEVSITMADAGVQIDSGAIVSGALERSRSSAPTRVMRAFGAGGGEDIDAYALINRGRLRALSRRARSTLSTPARDARIAFSASGAPRIIPAVDGQSVRIPDVESAIRTAALMPAGERSIRLSVSRRAPQLSTADAGARYSVFVVVDKARQRLTLYRDLSRVKTYRVSTAMAGYSTPDGEFPISNKQRNPTWTVPNSPWAGELAGRVIPPGPSNPLRERWMGLADGVGIHGTTEISRLGSVASHGCIRMSPVEVIDLFDRVEVGTPVIVRSGSAA